LAFFHGASRHADVIREWAHIIIVTAISLYLEKRGSGAYKSTSTNRERRVEL